MASGKNLAEKTGRAACGIGFVRVDMHGECIRRADSYDNVAENQRTTVGIDLNGNDLLVTKRILFGVFGGHVNVTLGDDHAVLEFNLTLRSDDLTACAALKVARLTHGSLDTDGACIACGKLNLRFGSYGTENGNGGETALRADNGNSFFTGILSRLGKILFLCKLIALTEQNVQHSAADVNVTGRSFNKNFFIHNKYLRIFAVKKTILLTA